MCGQVEIQLRTTAHHYKRLAIYGAGKDGKSPVKDKQQLVVDNYARWRILDPLQFYRTVRNEDGAASRLDDIIAECTTTSSRLGYFAADPEGRPGAPVFNRTVSLKETWSRP